ncbi:hypothetical protein BH11ARM2_BH11ARM2_03440 [soil metagenome]
MKHLSVTALSLISACAMAQNVDHLWAAGANGPQGQDVFNDSVTDGNGFVYTVGTRSVGSGSDIIVTKTQKNGKRIWSRQLDFSADDQGRALAVRPDGSIILTGSTGTGGLLGTDALFLAHLSAAGSTLWTRQIARGAHYAGHDVAVADDDSIIVAGGTQLLTDLLEQPSLARYSADGGTLIWSFDLTSNGTARHLVLGDGRVYYAGERRTVLNDLGVQVAGNVFVGSCNLNGSGRDTETVGALDATYERIHKLERAGPNRVLFAGWKGLTVLGEGAVPLYGMLTRDGSGSHVSTIIGSLPNTVATDISYNPINGRFAAICTSLVNNTTQAVVQVASPDGQGGFGPLNSIPLPGEGGYAHSTGWTTDGQWVAAYATEDGGRLALGSDRLVSVDLFPRISLGWSAIGIPASEHPPTDQDGDLFWFSGDTANGARVTGNMYFPGPEDTINVKEDSVATLEVTRNDAAIIVGERYAKLSDAPKHGTVKYSGGSATYEPAPDFNGTDTFKYRFKVGGVTIRTTRVTVNVTPVNDPPTAQDHTYNVSAKDNTPLLVIQGSTDPDGDKLKIASVTQPEHGTVSIHDAGQKLVYQPETGFTGTVMFTYTLTDKHGGNSTAHVTLNVAA